MQQNKQGCVETKHHLQQLFRYLFNHKHTPNAVYRYSNFFLCHIFTQILYVITIAKEFHGCGSKNLLQK